MLATSGHKRDYNEGVLVGNWAENRARRSYNKGLERFLSTRSTYSDDFLPKITQVEHTSRDKAINAKIGNVKVRGMEAHPMTTSYNLEFSPRKPATNRDWKIIHNQWLPERSSLDSRIRSGTHQNWGLWEETKSKMKPEDFTIQSDYTANYHGNIEFLKSAFGTFGE